MNRLTKKVDELVDAIDEAIRDLTTEINERQKSLDELFDSRTTVGLLGAPEAWPAVRSEPIIVHVQGETVMHENGAAPDWSLALKEAETSEAGRAVAFTKEEFYDFVAKSKKLAKHATNKRGAFLALHRMVRSGVLSKTRTGKFRVQGAR